MAGPGPSLPSSSAQSKGTVTLLHVIETIAGLSLEEERDFYDRLEETARGRLDRLGKELEKQKVPWKAEIVCGHRVPECVRHPADTNADLIILTAPKIDPANPAAGLGQPGSRSASCRNVPC